LRRFQGSGFAAGRAGGRVEWRQGLPVRRAFAGDKFALVNSEARASRDNGRAAGLLDRKHRARGPRPASGLSECSRLGKTARLHTSTHICGAQTQGLADWSAEWAPPYFALILLANLIWQLKWLQ